MVMKVSDSRRVRPAPPNPATAAILREVSAANLKGIVEALAVPRHYSAESRANRWARDWLIRHASGLGYRPVLQGAFDNIVLASGHPRASRPVLFGAHYDTVPGSPGADDNASAMAVCLECARLCAKHGIAPVMIVFFNREEDGFLGSREFVSFLGEENWRIREAHVFEMVGYRSHAPGSQAMPKGLPVAGPTVGDFLALIANSGSNAIADRLLSLAAAYLSGTPVLALKTWFGVEKHFRPLNRSDHVAFWEAGLPAMMWTDTSEFRNPNYHLQSDRPETLDYDFMADVTRLALARAVQD